MFVKKDEANGVRFKARLVIRGFGDKNVYELMDTYAPVARLTDVRFILAVANKFKLQIRQYDVKTAFLNAELDKTVYMQIPKGHENYDKLHKTHVCKLQKSLYGLKVSSRKWYEKFKDTMVKLNFTVYPFQSCLFVWRKGNQFIILLLYVDDILTVYNHKQKMQEVERLLAKEFEIRNLGSPKKFLGLEIERDCENQVLYIHQRKFAEKMLKRFDMDRCNPVSTPMITREGERKSEGEKLYDEKRISKNELETKYRRAVGSLLYLCNGSRPDLAYAVNALSKKQNNCTEEDWMRVKRVFRYVRGTIDLGLRYTGQGEQLECYADASLGVSDSEGKSTSGILMKLFGDVIYWRTKKQTHVALSTAEAEFIAMSLACKELTCIKEM